MVKFELLTYVHIGPGYQAISELVSDERTELIARGF